MTRVTVCIALLATFAAGGCLSPGQPPLLADRIPAHPRLPLMANNSPAASESSRQAAVYQAQRFLSGAPLRAGDYDFEPTPVGFVRAAYWSVGVDLFQRGVDGTDGMEILYRSAAERRSLHRDEPRPGDLVFFDADRSGKGDQPPRGVAVVEEVRNDGTVIAIGSFARGPRRIALNLEHPSAEQGSAGERLNDRLRGRTDATTAQLFRSFADPF